MITITKVTTIRGEKTINTRRFPQMMAMAACVGLSALISSQRVFADAPASPGTFYIVAVGGTEFLRLRTNSGGLDAQKRADKVQERVNHALSMGPIYPKDITVGTLNSDWVVYLKGKRFFTADAETAKMDNISPHALVEQWAARLRLILPDLTKPTYGKG